MKLQRRKFFGLMGGAAIAGPSIAKDAVEKMPVGLGDIDVWGNSYGVVAESIKPSKSSRILELRRLISGEFTKEEIEDRRRDKMRRKMQLINQEIASLRSVSGVRKIDMYQERCVVINDAISRSYNMGYLERLLSGEENY